MKCLEFKRLALSEPNSGEHSFVEHSKICPDCLVYVGELRKMDADLTRSLDVNVPTDLVAKLQLNQELQLNEELQDSNEVPSNIFGLFSGSSSRFAIAASLAAVLFVGGFLLNNFLSINNQIGDDYESMLSGVVDHMQEQATTPSWKAERANNTLQTLLASYDADLKLRDMDNLRFSRICHMGEYRGLHAKLETSEGQITFAYIKGDSVGELLDVGYEGYTTRVKPIQGGNLLIISRTQKALEEADSELQQAMYWDI